MRKAPPAIVIIGEGIGTMICSIKPPKNMADWPLVLISCKMKLRIDDMDNSITQKKEREKIIKIVNK